MPFLAISCWLPERLPKNRDWKKDTGECWIQTDSKISGLVDSILTKYPRNNVKPVNMKGIAVFKRESFKDLLWFDSDKCIRRVFLV